MGACQDKPATVFSEAEMQQHRRDRNKAQKFNSIALSAEDSILAYRHKQQFQLRHRSWKECEVSAKIYGPDGRPWFELARTGDISAAALFKADQFAICTLSGENIMLLQETLHSDRYEYLLFRVHGQTRHQDPICRVIYDLRKNSCWTIGGDKEFDIKLNITGDTDKVHCSGPSEKRTLQVQGHKCAVLEKPLCSCTGKYNITIGANTDVLLFLGIACAIDRVEREVDSKRTAAMAPPPYQLM